MRGGFTLLETLIGLVIAALIAMVMLDSLTAIAGQAARVTEEGRRQAGRILALMPVQRALEASVPDYHDASGVFRGEASLASGLTMASVSGQSGRPARFELRIEKRADQPLLVYLEQDRRLFEIPVEGTPVFAYRDPDGRLHEIWPPADGFGAEDPLYFRPLPTVILVISGGDIVFAAATARTAGLVVRSEDLGWLL